MKSPRPIRFAIAVALAMGLGQVQAFAAKAKSFSIGQAKFGVLPVKLGDQYNLHLVAQPVARPAKPAPLPPSLRLLFGVVDAKNHYALTLEPNAFELAKVVAGKSRVLAKRALKPALATPFDVLVKRRRSLLTVVVNDRVLAESLDDTFAKGAAALEITHRVPKLSKLKVQKYAPIHQTDDFMVAIDAEAAQKSIEDHTAVLPSVDVTEVSGWDKVSGDWRLFSVLDEVRQVPDQFLQARIATSTRKPDAARSANPFSLSGKATKREAVLLKGYAFWDNYTFSVSANSSGSTFGLIFYHRAANDYFALEWAALSVRERVRAVRLVRVTPKGRQVLATAYAPSKIDQWYRLGVETYGQRIRCLLDGVCLFDVRRSDAIGGRVGLIVRGEQATHFDDVDVHTTPHPRYDSAAFLRQHSSFDAKQWHVNGSGEAVVKSLTATPPAFAFGGSKWAGYLLAATVRSPDAKATIGLGIGPVEFEWSAKGMRLTHTTNGKAATLASASSAIAPNKPHRIVLDCIDAAIADVYVDNVLELRGRLPAAISGRCRLIAAGAPGVQFSNLEVAFERDEDCERPVSNMIFTEDPYMLHWSSPQGAWVPAGSMSRFWHKGDFFGAFSIKLPFVAGTKLLFCNARPKPMSDPEAPLQAQRGYAVAFGSSSKTLALERLGKTLKTITLPKDTPPRAPITVAKNGKYIWIMAAKKQVLAYRDASPLTGRRVALITPQEVDADYFADVVVERNHVHDDYFDRATSDWRKVGRWQVINRFACDPRWSHMTAMSEHTVSILGSKAEYQGDFTLEFYAGNKMWPMREWESAQYYPRVGDINTTICYNGHDLDSGYTITLAEWDNTWSETWTRLRRGTKVVAESDRELVPRNRETYPSRRIIPVPWIKKGRAIHGAWYYIKVRKIGNRIEYYFDNQLVLNYTDPKPLTGRHLAIWTQKDYVTFARVKVSYATKPTPSPVERPAREADNATAVEGLTSGDTQPFVRVGSPTHPGASFDFEGSLDGWSNIGGASGALLEVDTSTRARGKSSLRVTNIETGGCFGVRVPVEGLRMADAIMQFHYRLDPGVKINFYFKLADEFDRWYFVQFTGDAPQDASMVSLGKFRKPRADRKWRLARFALGDALRAVRPHDGEQRVQEMRIGYFHEGYLNAGIGGNHEGASYSLDAFRIFSPGPAKATLDASLSSGKAKGFAAALDRSPKTEPAAKVSSTSRLAAVKATKPGQWFWHVRACDDKGRWTPTTHFAFDVEAQPLAVAKIKPADKANWGGAPITVYFKPRTGPNLDPDSIQVAVNGQRIEAYPHAVNYDFARRYMQICMTETPCRLADGKPVVFKLSATTSAHQPVSAQWTYTMRASQDRWGPTNVRLLNYPAQFTFDADTDGVRPLDGKYGAAVSIDRRSRRKGYGSLKGTNVHMGGSAGVLLYHQPFSFGRCPLVSFDYRIPKTYRLNLLVDAGGQTRSIQLTDPDRRARGKKLGAIEGAEADNTWRHAEINVAELIHTRVFAPAMFDASTIALSDTGYQGVGPNMEFHLDNFALVPTVSGKLGVKLKWQAYDLSGVSHYRYRWSKYPTHSPNLMLPGDQTEHTFYVTDEGDQYFHLAAQDARGRWSQIAHYRFIVDNTAPQYATPDPAPGAKSAATTMNINIVELGSGVDPSSLQIEVNGERATLDDALAFDVKSDTLTWNWAKTRSRPSFANHAEVRCAAAGVRDFAGNLSPRIEWSWFMDYSQDTTPPAAPEVTAASQRILQRDTFERGLGDWMSMGERYYYTRLYRSKRASTQPADYCVQVYRAYNRGSFGAFARTKPFRPDRYPIVAFDYCFKRGVKVDMALQIDGEFYVITLTAPAADHKVIGKVPNFKADAEWHSAWLDLRPMLAKAFPKKKGIVVQALGFGDFGENGNARRTWYRIDNFTIAGEGAPKAAFKWQAHDLAGVRAYQVALDRKPDTLPATPSKGASLTKTLGPGMWFLHVRAQDRAGNWGQPAHYAYYVPGAKAK